ncbi:MAG: hypothetical protein HY072_00750, partial [Deltaproteobacteria bacterium]|nr:hypothetical protein [Deltaproteobacteria bacterium]
MLHKFSILLQYLFGQPKSLNRILAITALVYVYFIGGFINNSITNSVSTLTVALVENQTIVINPYLFDRRDVAKYNDNYYSGVPPGASFLLTPVYSLVKTALFLLPHGLEKEIDSF